MSLVECTFVVGSDWLELQPQLHQIPWAICGLLGLRCQAPCLCQHCYYHCLNADTLLVWVIQLTAAATATDCINLLANAAMHLLTVAACTTCHL